MSLLQTCGPRRPSGNPVRCPRTPARGRILTAVLALVVAAAGIGIAVEALGNHSRSEPGATPSPPTPSTFRVSPSSSAASPPSGHVTLRLRHRDGPLQTARLQDGQLVVEAPFGELEWVLNPAGGCSLTVSPVPNGAPLASFGGGCGGPWAGVSGTTWKGEIIRAVHGSTVPGSGWVVRVTFDNGDTYDVTPLHGQWMLVFYGCRGTDQVWIDKVTAVAPSGAEHGAKRFGPLPAPVDPCNRPTPIG